MTFTGAVTGSGNLTVLSGDNGAGSVTLSSAANSLSGTLQVGDATYGTSLTVNSWADSANPIRLYGNASRPAYFTLGAGTASPLLFNSRQIQLLGATGASVFINNNNATAANTITINTDLVVTSVGAKTLTLGGTNTGTNTFAGKIADGPGSVISLTKAGAGTWILSGANTYTGNTTVSGGTLVLAPSGGLSFKVTDTTANKVTGAGAATLNGSFTIDTTAVTLGAGSSWTLVDVVTKSYGPNFSVTGFTGPDSNSLWKRVNGSQIWFFNPATGKLFINAPGQIVAFGIPGSSGVIDQTLKTIALTVPYTPYGVSGLGSLAPNFTLSSGTCDQTSGAPPSPTFAAQNPATYTVTDDLGDADPLNDVVNTYTVMVTVTPASTAKVMSNVRFPGMGYAHATDATATSFVLNVTSGTPVNPLSPTYDVSAFASGSPVSGTPLDFTNLQTYTITAEDGASQDCSVAVLPYTDYAAKVMASNPFAYWPLNEGVGFVAYDNTSGNNGSYSNPGVSYNVAGPAVENAVSFSGAAGVAMRVPQAAALCPDSSFSVEMWVMPAAVPLGSSPQYVASNAKMTSPREGWYLAQDNGATFLVGQAFVVRMFNRNGTTQACQLYAPIDTVRWYHLVLTYDSNTKTARFYEDGVTNETDQYGKATLASYFGNTSTNPFTVGIRSDSSLPWAGSASHLAFYTRALTQAEVQNHYNYQSTTPYGTWATGGEPFDGDANGDGVKNGIAFLLGAANPGEDASGRLPTVSESGGGLVMTFNCLPVSARGGATLRVEHSSDLGVLDPWTATVDVVPDATNAVPDNNVTFVVGAGPVGPPALNSVSATIDSAAAAGGKLFGRLRGHRMIQLRS